MGVIDVAIEPLAAPGSFVVRVLDSPAGEASATVALDAAGLLARRDELQQAVLASAVTSRRLLHGAEQCVREVGQALYSALLGTGEVAGRYRAAAAVAAERGQRLRVLLRVEDPLLASLPWEAMYDQAAGVYVCRRDQLVRRIPVPAAAVPLPAEPPLRILGLVSSPRGLPPLDESRERALLVGALSGIAAAGRAELTWAPSAMWADLQDVLMGGSWHVVHFIGHGDYDVGRDEGVVALTGEAGQADLVEASRLVDLLGQARPMPRLVVLNSCAGAASGWHDLFAGTATALVRGGVSAAVAMQYEISDRAAVVFARGFYNAIGHGRGVDDAVSSGRVAIMGISGRSLEWITPVLYLRGDNCQLLVPAEDSAHSLSGHFPADMPASADAARRQPAMPGTTGASHSGELEMHDHLSNAPAAQPIAGQFLSSPPVEFVGRADDLANVLKALIDPLIPLITIKGMGGIGKTALAQEAARRMVAAGRFDQIVWKSAQAERFVGEGLVRAEVAEYSLDALLADILVQSGMPAGAAAPIAVKREAVRDLLSAGRILIILDNLETVPDRDSLVASLFELLGKANLLVTSRYAVAHYRSFTIDLGGLSAGDGIAFLRMTASRQNNRNLMNAPDSTLARVHDVTGGAPLAMMLVSGQMKYQPIDHVLRGIEQAGVDKLSYDFYSFLFRRCWNGLTGRCRRVLVAMRHFEGSPTAEALRYTADMSEDVFYSAATVLAQRSLLSVVLEGGEEARYALHPLTRYFINTDIAAEWD